MQTHNTASRTSAAPVAGRNSFTEGEARHAAYRQDDGWTSFDGTRGALTAEELQAERSRATRML